jgi:hypothetical protein
MKYRWHDASLVTLVKQVSCAALLPLVVRSLIVHVPTSIVILLYREVVLSLTGCEIGISLYTKHSQLAYIQMVAEQNDGEEQMTELHALSARVPWFT